MRRRGASAAISRDGHLARRGEWWGSAADIMRPRAGGEFYPRRADARGLLSFGVFRTNNINIIISHFNFQITDYMTMMSDTSNDYKDIAHIYVPIQFRFCHYESVTKGQNIPVESNGENFIVL